MGRHFGRRAAAKPWRVRPRREDYLATLREPRRWAWPTVLAVVLAGALYALVDDLTQVSIGWVSAMAVVVAPFANEVARAARRRDLLERAGAS